MSTFLEFAKQFEVVRNEAVEAFVSAAIKQMEAVEKGSFTRRSWAKPDKDGYTLKLGKLEKLYQLSGKNEVIQFLSSAVAAARNEPEFKALIEAAYGGGSAEEEAPKPRRGRKPKNA